MPVSKFYLSEYLGDDNEQELVGTHFAARADREHGARQISPTDLS
jgi:hypothetical protein